MTDRFGGRDGFTHLFRTAMGLYQLIYQSEAVAPFTTRELRALLYQSRAYNGYHLVSGLLLHTPDGQFLQVLEGEESVVGPLYHGRIAQDARHAHCRVLSAGPCLWRSFADWTMGFRVAQAADLRALLGGGAPPPPELLELLLDFVANCETEPWREDPRRW